MGRSSKALCNITTGITNKLLLMLFAFITRTLFIRILGAEYTGISSLFINILSVLSLAELGVGNVLMYYLYSALNENDELKIHGLVEEFKIIYKKIICLILFIGILIIPFLKFIINSNLDSNELIVYYVLYLVDSVASYFVVYRTMVISADQKGYIENIVQTITTICMYCLQISYLLLYKDFLGYLIIQVGRTIINNIILNYIALKKYPYLRNKINDVKISFIDRKDLLMNIKATFLFKLSDKIVDQTGVIIISIMFGTVFVGYYYNYNLLISYVISFAAIIVYGLVAGFGNLVAQGDTEQSYKMFCVSLLAFAFFGTYCTAAYACIVQEFIPIWVGSNYKMGYDIVIAILLVFYLKMATNTVWMYRSAMGIFKEVQYINLIAAVLNIVLSVLLGKAFGVSGVIIAAALARLFTSFWFEAQVVFIKFSKPVSIYYKQQIKAFLICVLVVLINFMFCNMINIQGIRGIISRLIVVSIITIGLEFLFYHKTEEYHILKLKICNVLKKR